MITFDPDKNRSNQQKHGVPLELASQMFQHAILETIDTRHDEDRYIAIGLIEGRTFVCVYTWHADVRRIISLRKATRREEHAYFKEVGQS